MRTKDMSSTHSDSPMFAPEGEEISFRIDESGINSIIDRLTDVYDVPAISSVREVFSNAYDANIARKKSDGYDGKISVELPTPENGDSLTISDEGLGIDYETLKNVYSSYATSTKKSDLDSIGAFGMGAKAPFSLVNTFSIYSVSAHEIISAVALRSKGSVPKLVNIERTENTGEPLGTSVSIPLGSVSANERNNAIDTAIKMVNLSLDFRAEVTNYEQFCTIHGNEKKSLEKLSDYLHVFTINYEGCDMRVLWRKNIVSTRVNINEVADGTSRVGLLYNGFLYNSSRDVLVELKPGIVDFPSSRDSIISNTRYNDFIYFVGKSKPSKEEVASFFSRVLAETTPWVNAMYKNAKMPETLKVAKHVDANNDAYRLAIREISLALSNSIDVPSPEDVAKNILNYSTYKDKTAGFIDTIESLTSQNKDDDNFVDPRFFDFVRFLDREINKGRVTSYFSMDKTPGLGVIFTNDNFSRGSSSILAEPNLNRREQYSLYQNCFDKLLGDDEKEPHFCSPLKGSGFANIKHVALCSNLDKKFRALPGRSRKNDFPSDTLLYLYREDAGETEKDIAALAWAYGFTYSVLDSFKDIGFIKRVADNTEEVFESVRSFTCKLKNTTTQIVNGKNELDPLKVVQSTLDDRVYGGAELSREKTIEQNKLVSHIEENHCDVLFTFASLFSTVYTHRQAYLAYASAFGISRAIENPPVIVHRPHVSLFEKIKDSGVNCAILVDDGNGAGKIPKAFADVQFLSIGHVSADFLRKASNQEVIGKIFSYYSSHAGSPGRYIPQLPKIGTISAIVSSFARLEGVNMEDSDAQVVKELEKSTDALNTIEEARLLWGCSIPRGVTKASMERLFFSPETNKFSFSRFLDVFSAPEQIEYIMRLKKANEALTSVKFLQISRILSTLSSLQATPSERAYSLDNLSAYLLVAPPAPLYNLSMSAVRELLALLK